MVFLDPAFWISLFGWFWLKNSEAAGAGANSSASALTHLAHGLGRPELLGLQRRLLFVSTCSLSLQFLWHDGFHAREYASRERTK